MVQIVHISDLHLFVPRTVSGYLRKFISHVPKLPQLCSFAYGDAQTALPDAVKQATVAIPAVLAVTGDIAAWPYDSSQSIDRVYYGYIEDVFRRLAISSLLLVTLGNHEWTPDNRTNFRNTYFDHKYGVFRNPQVRFFRLNQVGALFFIIDTTDAILPATGLVRQPTIHFLSDRFVEGHRGMLRVGDGRKQLTALEYEEAVKVVLLHHHTLPPAAYGSRLSPQMYSSLELMNRLNLLHTCRDEIDVFMFGHTHEPNQNDEYGFVMIDAGSGIASDHPALTPGNAQFQVVKILGRTKIDVTPHQWNDAVGEFQEQAVINFERSGTRWKKK